MSNSDAKATSGFSPMIASGEYLTLAFRRWGFDCAVKTCPDMTLRQFEALLDGRARLIGDTGSGLFYEGGLTPPPSADRRVAAMATKKDSCDA